MSPHRQLTLLIEISRLAKQGAQFIIASHSPVLLGIPNAQILSFDDGYIHDVVVLSLLDEPNLLSVNIRIRLFVI